MLRLPSSDGCYCTGVPHEKPRTPAGLPRGVPFRHRTSDAARTLPAHWVPQRSISVIIDAVDEPEGLELTLAALANQTYAHGLFDVAVALGPTGSDDLSLPRPERVRTVVSPEGSGHAGALGAAVDATDGEIVLWLAAGDVPAPDLLAEAARCHDQIDDAVVLRTITEVDDEGIHRHDLAESLDTRVASLLSATRDARDAAEAPEIDDEGVVLDTALTSISTPRNLYLLAGGLDPTLPHGGERDLIYRLAARGAALLAAPRAAVLRTGRTATPRLSEIRLRTADPFDAQRVPLDGGRLRSVGRVWQVPLIHAVVRPDQATAQYARACVDRLLASRQTDIHVTLVAPAGDGTDRMQDEFAAVVEWFRGDSRVTLAPTAPDTVFPAAFRLDVPVVAGLSPDTLDEIIDVATSRHAGLVRVPCPGGDIALLRTAADERAHRRLPDVDNLQQRIDAVWGVWWARLDGIVDLTTTDDLDAPVRRDDTTAHVSLDASIEPPSSAPLPAGAAVEADLPDGFRAPLGLLRAGLRGLLRELARRLGRRRHR